MFKGGRDPRCTINLTGETPVPQLISNHLTSELLSLSSLSLCPLCPLWFNHSDITGIDIT